MTSNVKDTNPKDAIGIRKFAFSVLPLRVMAGVTLAFLEGALKYGRHNYRIAGVRASVYFDAAIRHLFRYWEGEDLDPEAPAEAKLHHIDKAIASLIVLRDAMLNDMLTDDRPPRLEEWASDLNERASALLDAYPEPVKPYTIEDTPDRGTRLNPELVARRPEEQCGGNE